MGQNFDQAKCDNTFWPMPNILKGSVLPIISLHLCYWQLYFWSNISIYDLLTFYKKYYDESVIYVVKYDRVVIR